MGGALPPDLIAEAALRTSRTFDMQVEVARRMGYRDLGGAARSRSSCR